MDANEAWEQFKKAVAAERQGPSISEKLDVLSAQALQTSTQLDEMDKKLDEIAAPTGDDQSAGQMPIPGQEMAMGGMGGGMPGGGAPAAGAPPDMMAQMMGGGAPSEGGEEEQQPPRGAAQAGSQIAGASFQASASKKKLRSRTAIAKDSCEKGVVGMGSGTEVNSTLEKIKSLAGNNVELLEQIAALEKQVAPKGNDKSVAKSLRSVNSNTESITKFGARSTGGLGAKLQADAEKKRQDKLNRMGTKFDAAADYGYNVGDGINLSVRPNPRELAVLRTTQEIADYLRKYEAMAREWEEDPELLDKQLEAVFRHYGLNESLGSTENWLKDYQDARSAYSKWDYDNGHPDLYIEDPVTHKLSIRPHEGLADSEMRAFAKYLEPRLIKLQAQQKGEKGTSRLTRKDAMALAALNKIGLVKQAYKMLAGYNRGRYSGEGMQENIFEMMPKIDLLQEFSPGGRYDPARKDNPIFKIKKPGKDASSKEWEQYRNDLNASMLYNLREAQKNRELERSRSVPQVKVNNYLSKDKAGDLAKLLATELGENAEQKILAQFYNGLGRYTKDKAGSLAELLTSMDPKRELKLRNPQERTQLVARNRSDTQRLENIINTELKKWSDFKSKFSTVPDTMLANMVQQTSSDDILNGYYNAMLNAKNNHSRADAGLRYLYPYLADAYAQSQEAQNVLQTYAGRSQKGEQAVIPRAPLNLNIVRKYLFGDSGKTFSDLRELAQQSALEYAQKQHDRHRAKIAAIDYADAVARGDKDPEKILDGFTAQDFFDVAGVWNGKALHNLPSREEYNAVPAPFKAEIDNALAYKGLTPDDLYDEDTRLAYKFLPGEKKAAIPWAQLKELWESLPESDEPGQKLQLYQQLARKMVGRDVPIPTKPILLNEESSPAEREFARLYNSYAESDLNDKLTTPPESREDITARRDLASHGFVPDFDNMVSTGREDVLRYLARQAPLGLHLDPNKNLSAQLKANLERNPKPEFLEIGDIISDFDQAYRSYRKCGLSEDGATARAFKDTIGLIEKVGYDFGDYDAAKARKKYLGWAKDKAWLKGLNYNADNLKAEAAEENQKIPQILMSKFIGNLDLLNKLYNKKAGSDDDGDEDDDEGDEDIQPADILSAVTDLHDLAVTLQNENRYQPGVIPQHILDAAKATEDSIETNKEFDPQTIMKTLLDAERNTPPEEGKPGVMVRGSRGIWVPASDYLTTALTPPSSEEKRSKESKIKIIQTKSGKYAVIPATPFEPERKVQLRPKVKYGGKIASDYRLKAQKDKDTVNTLPPRTGGAKLPSRGYVTESDPYFTEKQGLVSDLLITLYPVAFGIDHDSLTRVMGRYGKDGLDQYMLKKNDLLNRTARSIARSEPLYKKFEDLNNAIKEHKLPDKDRNHRMELALRQGMYSENNAMPEEFARAGLGKYNLEPESGTNFAINSGDLAEPLYRPLIQSPDAKKKQEKEKKKKEAEEKEAKAKETKEKENTGTSEKETPRDLDGKPLGSELASLLGAGNGDIKDFLNQDSAGANETDDTKELNATADHTHNKEAKDPKTGDPMNKSFKDLLNSRVNRRGIGNGVLLK